MAGLSARAWLSRAPLLLALVAGPAASQDWPQWRGPARDGRAPGFVAPKAWPAAPRKQWQVPVGKGHASPIVAAGRAYLFAREGEQEVVSAFDLADGRTLWRHAYPAPYTVNPAASGHGPGPKSTPVLHDGRLYAFGIGGVLSSLEAATGRLVWRKDFAGEYRETSPLYGAALSPAVEAGLLLAHVGGHDAGAFTAFDAATGAVRWAARGEGPAYASPVVATLAGARQVVTQTRTHVVGLSASDGRRLWQVPFTTEYDQNAVTPVVDADVVIYSGLDKGVLALRIVRGSGGLAAEPLWDTAEVSLYMSSPVLAGGRLFGLSHKKKGQYFCLDAASGRTLWLSEGRQGENASLVVAGDHVLLFSTEGRLVVTRRDAAAFAALASYTLAEGEAWAHPAPAGPALLVKDAGSLTLWRFE
jgi:outer membrane protein assembly factor BamB